MNRQNAGPQTGLGAGHLVQAVSSESLAFSHRQMSAELKGSTMIKWLEVQKRLASLGFYNGQLDGFYGPLTEQAIIEFKSSIGLRARPYFGPLTKAALLGSAASSVATPDNVAPWMAHAVAVKGIHEVRDYSRLEAWMTSAVGKFDWRNVPWCGGFVATIMRMYDPRIALPSNPLGARNWLKFGEACGPEVGAIVVFWRGSRNGWKGHVGYVARVYPNGDVACLGGNQSNAVNVRRFPKSRILGFRKPTGSKLGGSVLVGNAAATNGNEA